jgi:hypothetical protein
MRTLVGILGLIVFVLLLPFLWACVVGLAVMLPKAIFYGVGILALIVVVIFPILMCNPRERAALRQWYRESREKRRTARAAQEGGPQPSK